MSKFYVYQLIDPRDGKVFYVGKGCKRRMYTHAEAVKQGKDPKCYNGVLYERIKQILATNDLEYNVVLETNDEQIALDYEVAEIARIGRDNLCNQCAGGNGLKHVDFTPEIRAKISAAQKRIWSDPEYRKMQSEKHKGQVPWVATHGHSEETRRKLSEMQKGRKHSIESRAKQSVTLKGRNMDHCHTPEVITKANKKRIGVKQSPELIERRISKIRGRKHSSETIEKMRQAALNRKSQ
jgi:hypothetical protein